MRSNRLGTMLVLPFLLFGILGVQAIASDDATSPETPTSETPTSETTTSETTTHETSTMHQATGTFDVTLQPQAPDAGHESTAIGRMTIDKTFEGALQGTSLGQMLAFRSAVEGSAGYVAMERVTGTLDGREGSFTLQHSGTMAGGDQHAEITVVPDSGTGGLTELAGTMTIRIEDGGHFYDFEYSLPE